MAVKILSIDGGGLRGLLPLWVLQAIEIYTKKRIFDCFDFFVGSSTGGIISAGLTVPKVNPASSTIKNLSPKFGVEEIIELYMERGSDIFPNGIVFEKWWRKKVKSLFYPTYSSNGLRLVLNDYFGDQRIGDCIKPIMIPSYCIRKMEPVWFRSRITRPSERNKIDEELANSFNIRIADALLGATAAPTYLPAYNLNFGLDEKTKLPIQRLCIDGGIYQNNPTNSSLVEFFRNQAEYGRKFGTDLSDLSDYFVLSLGTGRIKKSEPTMMELGGIGGEINWARPAIDISMWGNAQAVDFQVGEWMDFVTHTNKKINYLRINFQLENTEFEDMTNSSKAALSYYKSLFQSQFQDNLVVKSKLVDFLDGAGI